jgi:hypothetical protein
VLILETTFDLAKSKKRRRENGTAKTTTTHGGERDSAICQILSFSVGSGQTVSCLSSPRATGGGQDLSGASDGARFVFTAVSSCLCDGSTSSLGGDHPRGTQTGTLRRLQRAYHSTLDAVDPGRPRCLRRQDRGCPPPSAITDDHLRGVICNNDDDGNSESKEMQSRESTERNESRNDSCVG